MAAIKMLVIRCTAAVAAVLICLSPWTVASAQPYPSKPVRIVVPFPPGGAADVIARLVADNMAARYGSPVIVENRPGGNTIIAAGIVAKSAPDGYTLMLAIETTLVMNPLMYSKLPYDPLRDFAPVARLSGLPLVLVVNGSFPANNINELIALAKSKPGQINYGGGLPITQLAGELFARTTGTRMNYVHYKGGTATIMAVLSGEIPFAWDGISTTLPFFNAGKVKVFGVTSARRLSTAPSIPTFAELGMPAIEASVWQSIVAPAGTPRGIVAQLNEDMVRIMGLPDIQEKIRALGLEPMPSTPEGLVSYIRSESEKWGKMVHELNMKIE